MPGVFAPAPEDWAQIPASTLQNTDAGRELRWNEK